MQEYLGGFGPIFKWFWTVYINTILCISAYYFIFHWSGGGYRCGHGFF